MKDNNLGFLKLISIGTFVEDITGKEFIIWSKIDENGFCELADPNNLDKVIFDDLRNYEIVLSI